MLFQGILNLVLRFLSVRVLDDTRPLVVSPEEDAPHFVRIRDAARQAFLGECLLEGLRVGLNPLESILCILHAFGVEEHGADFRELLCIARFNPGFVFSICTHCLLDLSYFLPRAFVDTVGGFML